MILLNKSAIKAMLFNRIADLLLLVAICSIYVLLKLLIIR